MVIGKRRQSCGAAVLMRLSSNGLRSGLLPLIGFAIAGCVVTPFTKPGDPTRTAVAVQKSSADPDAEAALPEEIGASHLLVQYAGSQSAQASIKRTKAEALDRARAALKRARSGEDFATLVREYSDEPGAADRGGALGRFPQHAMVKPFAKAAFRLKIGEISDVVESPFGYHVILRTE